MEKKLEELINNIQAMIKCPHCGSHYDRRNISIVGQMGQSVLVQLNCGVCKMPVMATIVAQNIYKNDKQSLGSQKSLSGDVSDGPVAADEIIEMHNFLDSFDGDFEQLFNS